MKWETKSFEELSLDDFHDLIALRIEVFVIEQNCPYQELDGKDKVSHHVIAWEGNEMMGTTRIVPPGVSYEQVSVGRVVISKKARGTGLGHELMRVTMQEVERLYGKVPVKISAQEHLKGYYSKHGFEQITATYLEDGIPHIGMLYKPTT